MCLQWFVEPDKYVEVQKFSQITIKKTNKMANSLVFNYIDAAKKQSLDKALAFIDAIKDVSVISYDDTNIRAELSDVSIFAHEIHIPERVGELANDTNYLVPDDISSFVTAEELESKGYLTDHQSLDAYAKNADINIHLSNLDASVEAALEAERADVATQLEGIRSDVDAGLLNVEGYVDDKVAALDVSLSATIAANKTSASNDLEYAITRARGDFDSSIAAVENAKQDKFEVGVGLSLVDGVLSTTIDTTLFRIVDELPVENIEDNKIYLVSTHNATTGDVYTEHIHTNGGWEKLGEFKATTDLTGYYTKDQVDNIVLAARQALENSISTLANNNNLAHVELEGEISALNTANLSLEASLNEKTGANASAISALEGTVADHKAITDANTEKLSGIDASIVSIANTVETNYSTIASLVSGLSNDVIAANGKVDDVSSAVVSEANSRVEADNALKQAIDASIIALDEDKASNVSVNDLALVVESKASSQSVQQLAEVVEGKANQSDLLSVAADLGTLSTSVNNKIGQVNDKIGGIETNEQALTEQIGAHNVLIGALDASVGALQNTISGLPKLHFQVVEELPNPNDVSTDIIYLIAGTGQDHNVFTEYIFVNGDFEKLGEQKFNIDEYAKLADVSALEETLAGAEAEINSSIEALDSSLTGAIGNTQSSIDSLKDAIWTGDLANGHFQTKYTNQDNSFSMIWNEPDGGGSMFKSADGVQSYVGVNDGGGAKELYGQLYVVNTADSNKGPRLSMTKNGMFYSKDVTSVDAENEIAVKGDIPSVEGLATETFVSEAIEAIPATDLTGLATETYVNDAIAAIPAPDFTGLATETFVSEAIEAIPATDLTGLATETYVGEKIDEKVGDLGNAQEAAPAHAEYWTINEDTFDANPSTESNSFEVVSDEASWNESYANGVLKQYYTKYPDEDLISTDPSTPDKTATFNDRIYVGTIGDSETEVRFKAGWLAKAQSITNVDDPTEVYYMERLDKESQYYGTDDEWKAQYPTFHGKSWTLYTDQELTQEAGKVFNIVTLEFDGFDHTYAAWIANGAQAPWICVNFIDQDINSKPVFKYEGKEDVKPWGDTIFGNGEGQKTWGIESLPSAFGPDATDPTKFNLFIEPSGLEYHPAEEAKEEIAHTVKSYADAKYADLLEKYNALLARVVALEEGQNG